MSALYDDRLQEQFQVIRSGDEREILRVARRLNWMRTHVSYRILHAQYVAAAPALSAGAECLALLERKHATAEAERDARYEEERKKREEEEAAKAAAEAAKKAKSNDATAGEAPANAASEAPTDGAAVNGAEPAPDAAMDVDDVATEAAPPAKPEPFQPAMHTSMTRKWLSILTLFALIDDYLLDAQKANKRDPDAMAEDPYLLRKIVPEPILLQQHGRQLCDEGLNLIKSESQLTSDVFNAKIYFAISRIYTLSGRTEELCCVLAEAYRWAVLLRHQMSIATIVNQLLQSYLATGQYDLAIRFTVLSQFPEGIRSTPQVVRCLFNLGRIQAVRLQYADALEKITAAINKLPSEPNYAFGFKLITTKWAVVVELLQGAIPSIQIFQNPHFKRYLVPYEELVLAVRQGNMTSFNAVLQRYSDVFRHDGTLFLVERLHHSVIRVALRRINLAYHRIYIADIARMLGIHSVADATSMLNKAISDGVLAAYIDHEHQILVSKSGDDSLSTTESAETFTKRILFCSEMYKEAKKALQFPEEESLKTRAAEADKRRKQQAEERTRAEDDGWNDEEEF